MARMPVLFVGHGSPMNAIEDNEFRRGWGEVARRLPKPRAVLCVSAHWETAGVSVTASDRPPTIHDFYGFPRSLFEVRYPAPGHPSLARDTALLLSHVAEVRLDGERGLDHGCWSVLLAMYPEADVPVVQLSLDSRRPASFHYELGKQLAPLREQGVLVLGSGDIVHNLGVVDFHRPDGYDWAVRFNDEVKKRIRARDHAALVAYESLGPDARRAVPTPEHYLPLLYALALQGEGDDVAFFNDETVMGSVSMTSLEMGS
jgi:4,5-DOPA dioxygenase extradiol